jgi:short-subunit dehydrogenase
MNEWSYQMIRDQVVIITGASAGIGKATAKLLARQGCRLTLVARRRDRLETLKAELEQCRPNGRTGKSAASVLLVPADITSPSDRQRIVEETLGTFHRIDALVNNAGYGQRGPVEIVPLEAIRANFEVNLFGLIGLTQLVIPTMREQRSGRIVNVSSVAGRIARPYSSVYDATKHALEAISDGLRGELSPFGIKVVLIEPGLIQTEFLQVADQTFDYLLKEPGLYASILRQIQHDSDRARTIFAPPDVIANLVHKALVSKRPRPRYVAPFHAKLFLAMRWLLPDQLFDSLVKSFLHLTPKKQDNF